MGPNVKSSLRFGGPCSFGVGLKETRNISNAGFYRSILQHGPFLWPLSRTPKEEEQNKTARFHSF